MGEVRRACAHASGIYLVGSRDARWRTAHTGSFRAWGAPDVTVGSGNFLPELVQRYLLQRARVTCPVRETCATLSEVCGDGQLPKDAVVVVAADGSAGIGKKAPLAAVPGAEEADKWCQALLAGASSLPPSDGAGPGGDACPTGEVRPGEASQTADWLRARGVDEAGVWEELRQVMADTSPRAELVRADSSLGVARYVARWEILGLEVN